MLTHPTLQRLEELHFTGMAKAFREQLESPEIETLTFEERLGLLVDREATEREDRRLKTRLKKAKLRLDASMEDLDYRAGRGLEKKLMLHLASCDWVRRHHNIVITGATGVGKSYVACSLAHKAILEGFGALYHRLSRLLQDLQLARGDGRYIKLLKSLSRIDVLVLDDWGLAQLTPPQQRDVLELLDDRHMRKSTIVTSQLPTDHWHEAMADPRRRHHGSTDPQRAPYQPDRTIHEKAALRLESIRPPSYIVRPASLRSEGWPTSIGISGRLRRNTHSAGERAIWAPVALLLLTTSIVVALDKSSKRFP